MNEPLAVTAAIIERDGEVLLAQRPPGGRHPGCWEFPGGKVEPGESPEQCLAREMTEEMGIRVEVGELLARVRHDYADLKLELLAFRCTMIEGEPEDLHCSAHAWVRPSDLGSYDLLPPDALLALALFRE
ncbi:MAG: (deoxy)nucleoside triphosphate pyrophosphohydrolase [Actinobacteria bacterium]|nr:(deoxy)nucleoside triphosphate pyrophosphohydrolase [Actinomycetota bacterium]MBU1943185.1 (deoxy)nucleoside triphosphate pyrophosphohydrolase [Actinomycetota bacterium]MBU2687863.1 (deoxy)nucleoside triphosphate pyrophosphohydrolase [Actinomycetota bacterium]